MSKSTLIKSAIPFTMVINDLLNSEELSLSAKGLYSFMYSKPNNWQFTIKSLAKQLKDSQYAIEKAMKELKQTGWVTYKKFNNGRGNYILNLVDITANHECRDLGENTNTPNHEHRDQEYRDELIIKKEQKKKLKQTNNKSLSQNDDFDESLQSLVSQSVSPCFFLDEKESQDINKTEDLSNDLLSIGLGSSQIKAILRAYEINLIDEAVVSTFQAQYQNRISESASQYFYGALNKLKEKDHQDLTLASKTSSLGKYYV